MHRKTVRLSHKNQLESKLSNTNYKMNVKKEKSFLPAELLRVRDRQTKNSGGEQRHRSPGPYKACNTKPQNASLHIHIANIDPSYCNTFSLSLSFSLSSCYHFMLLAPDYLQSFSVHRRQLHFSLQPFVLLQRGSNKLTRCEGNNARGHGR